eukprot:6270673-Pyramimonas_sp.AAC.1
MANAMARDVHSDAPEAARAVASLGSWVRSMSNCERRPQLVKKCIFRVDVEPYLVTLDSGRKKSKQTVPTDVPSLFISGVLGAIVKKGCSGKRDWAMAAK